MAESLHSVDELKDENVALKEPKSDLFPGLTPGVKAHDGFLQNHES